ncbi:coiled-coil domain-containing protein 77 [Nelusetta ayraudi]|uniref:coiled-coil domain-containing protein 77 n=1 Tax=Nelusetta ayraudi TaxID=303726 RepID=UPI003F720B17
MGSPTKTPRRASSLNRGRTPVGELESPLPPVQERLAYLCPSRELLEFYREKIAQYDEEHEELLQTLEKYRAVTDDQHKLQCELRLREEEIAELQNALSDMQVYLFQEREQSLRLYAENDRLKIRELEDRKKIQKLLTLVGPEEDDMTYLHREPPHKVTIAQKNSVITQEEHLSIRGTKPRLAGTKKEDSRRQVPSDGANAESLEKYKSDNRSLLLQVEALQAQLQEQTRLAKEQVESLLDDRNIKSEEAQAQRLHDQKRMASLTDKLERTQNLLYESTKDFLKLKFDTRSQEKSWMSEKDRLLRELESDHKGKRKAGSASTPLGRTQRLSRSTSMLPPDPQPEAQHARKEELKVLQDKLKQSHRLAEMYREQCISLESELAKIKEEGDFSREIFQERSDKMTKRLQLMTQRYKALEKRRAMEVEGYKTDLKNLREKFKDIEKQIIKATLNIGPNQDLAILHEVRETNVRTKKVQGELMALKAKIYGLENELKFS